MAGTRRHFECRVPCEDAAGAAMKDHLHEHCAKSPPVPQMEMGWCKASTRPVFGYPPSAVLGIALCQYAKREVWLLRAGWPSVWCGAQGPFPPPPPPTQYLCACLPLLPPRPLPSLGACGPSRPTDQRLPWRCLKGRAPLPSCTLTCPSPNGAVGGAWSTCTTERWRPGRGRRR